MAEGVCHWETDLRFSLQSQQWRLQQEKQHRKEPSALPLNHVTRTGRQYWNTEAPSRPGRSWRFFLYEQTTGLTALEGRRGTFVSHRRLLERADSLFSLQRCCWRATAKNPATFSCRCGRCCPRALCLGVPSACIFCRTWPRRSRGCVWAASSTLPSPFSEAWLPRRSPRFLPAGHRARFIFSQVWFYFQINRSREPLASQTSFLTTSS